MPAVAKRQFQITRCVKCDHALPTLIVGGNESNCEWECCNCSATYLANLASSSPRHLRASVRPLHYFPEHRQAATNVRAKDLELELRRNPRRPLIMNIPAMVLDDELFPVGEHITVLSRNLSTSGIAFVHTSPLDGNLAVLIDLPAMGYVQLLLEVVRCEPLGAMFEIGGAFFERR